MRFKTTGNAVLFFRFGINLQVGTLEDLTT